jgi:hypothetical protein
MSGSTRAITLTLDVRGAEQVQAALRQIGPVGEEALRRLDAAAAKSATGTRQATQAVTQFTSANDNMGRGVSSSGQRITAAGFQLQDFAVQVQGGTSALTAFAQQAPQFLGVFGAAGAISGAAVAVGAIAVGLLRGKDAVEEINAANRQWITLQGQINSLLDSTIEKQARIRREQITTVNAGLAGILTEAATTAERSGAAAIRLERARALLQQQLEQASPRNRTSVQGDLREVENQLADVRAAEAAAQARAEDARRTQEQLRTNPGALRDSRDALADARRIAAVPQVQRPVIEATIRAEREARELNLEGWPARSSSGTRSRRRPCGRKPRSARRGRRRRRATTPPSAPARSKRPAARRPWRQPAPLPRPRPRARRC